MFKKEKDPEIVRILRRKSLELKIFKWFLTVGLILYILAVLFG